MNFIAAEKKGPYGLLLVITDADILGKKFEEGKLQLDLSKDFYKGEEKESEEVKKLIPKAKYLHLTGKESVNLGVSLGIVNKNKILNIKKIPHAEVVCEE